ncbi:hypothetical protein ColLi_09078 [Colletotrichum liriopes]|uniref:Uncharacterized protein n=1 Tax=Colletotrichum liriopes TaxID=708192 RepID=A0AA37GS95_9PEZI|nr:hypothetical protein ColLi_09078 [Colletotrichum liriopes]
MATWDVQLADFVSDCQRRLDDLEPSSREIDLAARYLELEQQLSPCIDAVDLRAQLPGPIAEAIVSTIDPNQPLSSRVSTLHLADACAI